MLQPATENEMCMILRKYQSHKCFDESGFPFEDFPRKCTAGALLLCGFIHIRKYFNVMSLVYLGMVTNQLYSELRAE